MRTKCLDGKIGRSHLASLPSQPKDLQSKQRIIKKRWRYLLSNSSRKIIYFRWCTMRIPQKRELSFRGKILGEKLKHRLLCSSSRDIVMAWKICLNLNKIKTFMVLNTLPSECQTQLAEVLKNLKWVSFNKNNKMY